MRAHGAALAAGSGLALILAGLILGAVPLLVPGFGFVALGLAAPAWIVIAARGAGASRRRPAGRIVEGEPFEVLLDVWRGRFGAPGANVHDPLARMPVAVTALRERRRHARRIELRLQAQIESRGRHAFAPPSIWLSDPLGLATAQRRVGAEADTVLVLPRTEPVRWQAAPGADADGAGQRPLASGPAAAGELDGLRDYEQGTPATRIHWPALARGAGLLERRFASERGRRPLIVLDARADGSATAGARLDAAVRATASLALELARGGCTLLLPGSRTQLALSSDRSAWPVIHARLALVAPVPLDRPPPASSAASAGGPVIWVAATPELGPPATGAGSPGLIVVVPMGGASGDPGPAYMAQPPAFVVAGCAGFVVREPDHPRQRREAVR